ncbi:flagellin [Vibrio diazotrophicus]|uniref:flagellin n=1 Tax=Vibrio diazotrophicus TaxID=685 RepID=UPI0022AE9D0B|nr:flagellin [Vibrio diazotrophicus]MCZ4373422.1 flagellin [Vibrio diazotrophicus]
MALSTSEVRAHGIRLTGQERTTVTPSLNAGDVKRIASNPATYPDRGNTSTYSVSGILLTQGQQQATAVQIAAKSLQLVGKELGSIKRQLTQAMNQGVDNVPNIKENLTRSKFQIDTVLQESRFDGHRVIDNELNLKLNGTDVRRFSIPGLNVNRLQGKAEQIRLDFPHGSSVMLQFDSAKDGVRTVKMLDRSLIPLGMRASISEDGTVLFEASEQAYKQMDHKVAVTGQGHRFPAGQANMLNLKSEPDGVAELRFDLSSRDGIKQSIIKVNKHLQQTHASLEQANQYQVDIDTQMQTMKSQLNVPTSQQISQKLTHFNRASEDFASAFEALNAQANVRRHTVVALLS